MIFMNKKIISNKAAVWIMLLLFLGSIVGGAIEYSFGRQKAELPDTNIVRGTMTQGQQYAVLSKGYLLLKYSVPANCDVFCQKEVSNVEGVVQKYAPYVFLEETSAGTAMKMVAATYSAERDVEPVNAASVAEEICFVIPMHPECRRQRALDAIAIDNGSEDAGIPNISIG